MKILYSALNDLIPASLFTLATCYLCSDFIIIEAIMYIAAFLSLDLHSYIDKKLDYPNNIFIKHY